MVLAKENCPINVLQAMDRATALNCTHEILAMIKERMRTDDETTATQLLNM